MPVYQMKTGKMARKAACTYQKVEDVVVCGYKDIETIVVNAYKGIEKRFINRFLEPVFGAGDREKRVPNSGEKGKQP